MFKKRQAIVLAALVSWCATGSTAALLRRAPGAGNSRISLRKRLHVNTLIAEPGTGEVDWGSLYSFSNSTFTMPSGFRYTPEGTTVLWGRTEYAVGFDAVSSSPADAGRLTQFSQAVTLTATAVVHDGDKFDFAIQPQATVFLRDESGARLGAAAVARYDSGRNSIGATAVWSGATTDTATNPAGTLDLGFGFGRQLSGSKFLEKFTCHLNGEWERSTGYSRSLLGQEGIEYQITERFALDLSGQQTTGAGNPLAQQIAVGVTVSTGRLRWFHAPKR